MSEKIKFDIVSEKLIDTKTCNKLIAQIQDCFWPTKIDNVIFTIQPSALQLKLTEPDIEKKQTRKFKKIVCKIAKLADKKGIDPVLFVEKVLCAAAVIEKRFNYSQSADLSNLILKEKNV